MRFAATAVLSFLPLLVLGHETPLTEDASSAPTAVAAPEEAPAPTLSPEAEEELRRRQNPGQVVGDVVASAPTQQSPTTTYMANDGKGGQIPVVYTQLFSPVPEQWDAPKSGSIGLGDIQGEVGIVKTRTKRGLVAEATALAKRGWRLDGGLEKRAKKKGGSSGGSNGNNTGAASAMDIPMKAGVVLVAGLLAYEML